MKKGFNSIKRIVSISAAAVCMLSALGTTPINSDKAIAASDIMTPFEITENMQIGWNLGNTLDSTGKSDKPGLSSETAWGNPKASQELINAVKAKGFNTLRIPITWYQHLDENNVIDEEWLGRVKEVVDYAYSQDMYVIINLHHENWINRRDFATAYDEMSAKLKTIWTQIATYFSDYDQRLIYEGLNEPRETGTAIEWQGNAACFEVVNKLDKDFVDTVRSIESPYKDTRLLMIPSYCASGYNYVYGSLVVPDDEYVCVSIHAYSPYNFCMNPNVSQSAHDTFTPAYAAELDSIFANLRSYFTDKDIPVVIGEFSASNYNNTEARCEWADYYVTSAKKIGVPCVLWDNDAYHNTDPAEDHSYINRNTLEWYAESEPVVDSMMAAIADDTIAWGGERKIPTYSHDDLSEGKVIVSNPDGIVLDASVPKGESSPGYNATGAEIKDGELAIRFTGDVPILAFTDASWNNWTEISPYDIDKENGIAYYSYSTIEKIWGDTSTIAHVFAKTSTKTVVYDIVILGSSNIIEEPTTEPKFPVQNYDLDLTGISGKDGELNITFKGDAGAYTNGCVGYSVDADWVSIEWETTLDASGNGLIKIPVNDIPASITSAQAQIWWASTDAGFAEIELTDYKFVPNGATEILYGDATGDNKILIDDVVLIMSYVANPSGTEISEQGLINADVYQVGDGVQASDAASVQKFLTKIIPALPEA